MRPLTPQEFAVLAATFDPVESTDFDSETLEAVAGNGLIWTEPDGDVEYTWTWFGATELGRRAYRVHCAFLGTLAGGSS